MCVCGGGVGCVCVCVVGVCGVVEVYMNEGVEYIPSDSVHEVSIH